MDLPMRLHHRKYYPVWLGLAYLLAFVLWFNVPALKNPEFLFTLAGGITAVATFAYSRHLESARFLRELFVQFNARYDDLNDRLNKLRVLPADAALSDEQNQTLYDYFNLCAEEYFFYRAGYVDEIVWRAWANGMCQFYAVPQIRRLWEEELQLQSYYGFNLKILEDARRPEAADWNGK